jgi:F-type H+-transporting ATPase subunit b
MTLRRAATLAALLFITTPVLAMALQEEGAGSPLFSINLGLVIWTWVLFLLTLGVLAWKVFPYIAGGLEERHQKIQEAIDEARLSREEAGGLRDEQRELLEAARREAQEFVDKGKETADSLRKEILADARQQQSNMLEEAKREIQVERDQLVEEVRREAVEISIAAAERLLRARLDEEENRRLVREYLSELR